MTVALVKAEQQVRAWLKQQGITPLRLTAMAGHTNYVFRVEQDQSPQRSIVRLANHDLGEGLCPLAEQAAHVIRLHEEAFALGLAPRLLASDVGLGLMWLPDVGEPQQLAPKQSRAVLSLVEQLQSSGLDWSFSSHCDRAGLKQLQQWAGSDSALAASAERLLLLADQRAYAHLPLLPCHSDLNPGNCLYDSKRWWLIDWDFAGMQVAYWDYASLIIEHHWLVKDTKSHFTAAFYADLVWFCASFALLSLAWHQQRGSAPELIAAKQACFQQWLAEVA